MTGRAKRTNSALPLLLVLLLLLSGCGIASSYRPADKKTIRDFDTGSPYRKRIGVLVLTNTTVFTSDQITAPFMTAFLTGLKSTASDVQILLPAETANAPFLNAPPRIDNGDIDVFDLSAEARQMGMNAVVSPMLMDIRTSKKDSGFWFFREVSYILQLQTAAAVYDTITGSRLSLGILTEKIDISEQQHEAISSGQETGIETLVEVARDMGEELGERMGAAVEEARWMTSVIATTDDGRCIIPAGSDMGVEPGATFSVLDTRGVLTGLNGQRFIVPGVKTGEIIIKRVTAQQALCAPKSGVLPPVGSIVLPEKR